MEPAPELCVATVEAALGGVAGAACLCIIWRCCRRRSPGPSIKEVHVDAQPFPEEEATPATTRGKSCTTLFFRCDAEAESAADTAPPRELRFGIIPTGMPPSGSAST